MPQLPPSVSPYCRLLKQQGRAVAFALIPDKISITVAHSLLLLSIAQSSSIEGGVMKDVVHPMLGRICGQTLSDKIRKVPHAVAEDSSADFGVER